jgi:ATP-binding cassette subfamily E protein 1
MPRIAVIDRDACLKAKCHICIKACPVNRIGQPCIVADDEGYPVIDENLCTGCGICPKKCPTKVIDIINLVEEAGEKMHQYGVNSFRLYNLPLPQKGVVGLVGQNGIGKTTAIQILSGSLVPNLGEWWELKSADGIIDNFRGREIGNFFSKLKEGLRVSYKQQNVDKLRSDTVVNVFLGISKRLEAAVNSLGLHNVLNKKMNELSGGELQMVAIAQTLAQDADLYFFDEPCSYLDVRQRLVAAKTIRDLSEKAFVIVIEHDLAVLDYLTDYAYLLYGEPGTYGVISGLKASRTGINEYLDGFLTDENLRIRSEPIVFDVRGLESAERSGKTLLSYGALEKRYSNFDLKAMGGMIKDGEIIGILGPNATGKTTFVKMLAGVESPDKGETVKGLKVSYKPQYIRSPTGTVNEVLDEFDLDKGVLMEMQKELALERLLEKECSKLSGGELQRLAIAISLSQNADIYLLDEPSAFLDIEQRLLLAKVLKKRIKDGKAAFVVDHDIVFLDNISDRLIAFDGISGVNGSASQPLPKREGMNVFLHRMDITMRRDKDSLRPRINKPGSVLDREQKEKDTYYYV